MLNMVPRPVLAVLMLFPITPESEKENAGAFRVIRAALLTAWHG
jgi:hypothetical protein